MDNLVGSVTRKGRAVRIFHATLSSLTNFQLIKAWIHPDLNIDLHTKALAAKMSSQDLREAIQKELTVRGLFQERKS